MAEHDTRMGFRNVWVLTAGHIGNGLTIFVEKRKEEVDNSGKPGIVHFPR
jgi:hypothetical protein